MKRIFVFCVLATALISCSKDKFKTEPQVEIKPLSPDVVGNDGYFSFKAVIRDKEGDLKDTVKLVLKRYSVGTSLPLTTDTVKYYLSGFDIPTSTEIEFQANFSYGEQRDGFIFQNTEQVDREFSVGIIVQDEAGHKSEYKESNRITLKKV